MTVKSIRTDLPQETPYGQERDACAIYMSARKYGTSSFGTLKRALAALGQMGHRTGFVNGEGDGAGVQTDIPRQLWAKKLSQLGFNSSLATHPGFWVGHLMIPHGLDFSSMCNEINSLFNEAGLNLLVEQPGRVRMEALGRDAQLASPSFWQLAGYCEEPDIESRLLSIQSHLESTRQLHFASLSSHTTVYKVRGSVEALSRYYPDLQDRNFETSMVLCHARYSTNTVATFERAQPFSVIAHNGEINTISRFRQEARQINVNLPQDGSDTQDIDRTMHWLCVNYNLDLIEAMEMIFPPVPHTQTHLPPELNSVYARVRQSFGPYAQGPAAIVARYNDLAVASVDALGLRPLWFLETEKEYIFSSERGAILFENRVDDARPLSPGEKIALKVTHGQKVEIFNHAQIRNHLMERMFQREAPQIARRYWVGWSQHDFPPTSSNPRQIENGTSNLPEIPGAQVPGKPPCADLDSQTLGQTPWLMENSHCLIDSKLLAVCGWQQDQIDEIRSLATIEKDLVSSLGYDGPLAALSKDRVNLADFFKETVAVVTNPAIDRGREIEAFSTRVIIGARPVVGKPPASENIIISLETPLITGGHPDLGDHEISQQIAQQLGTYSLEQIWQIFAEHRCILELGVREGESIPDALKRLADQAVESVRAGAQCLILDDTAALTNGMDWLDPHLAVSHIDEALRSKPDRINLRRKAGVVVHSASIRNLHDMILLLGLGADAINPYAMLYTCLNLKADQPLPESAELVECQAHLLTQLNNGLEKVISTMGCHELRGYGRVCSSIGLSIDVANSLKSANYFGGKETGLGWEQLKTDSQKRGAELRDESPAPKPVKVPRFYPKFRKYAGDYARLQSSYSDMVKNYRQLAHERPVALRHILEVKKITDIINPANVDISIGKHSMPLLISAMSFGSQGELSYKALARAASDLNIICINGEGGELPEMLGLYKKNRGQQVASGRFGVNVKFLNSADVIEIKIGQGAKPGEGGMLPAYKVTPMVAAARHTPSYVPLLSPSNNHDLYSIEDLAQLIEELKVVNPKAKISVKLPIVPAIGVIAVGVAKAGADIISLSGYDGGTGAARTHALQYVGLPTEIGVTQSHRALTDAGLRHRVELWCDGGMKTGEDAIKMILLGANRVGFATMAMIAMGCLACRKCDSGKCPVGITTQIRTAEEAKANGIKNFTPFDYQNAVKRINTMFEGIGEEMRQLAAQLGALRVQDLVGRADLLQQIDFQQQIDLSAMLETVPMRPRPRLEPGVGRLLTRPRNSLTSFMSDLIVNTVMDSNEREVTYQDEAMAFDRALGSSLVGELVRNPEIQEAIDMLHLRFGPSSIAGNGFAAWTTDLLDILIEGGAQDGVAKGASGGRVAVMKGLNHEGNRIDGSVGKSFAYGAQQGVMIVQGDADSRACIRLSGADVILGGEITSPIDNHIDHIGSKANLKGYACEYMTSGRVLIMGDPGPSAFAGMSGGVVYQHLTPEMGFTADTLNSRMAQGATVTVHPVEKSDFSDISELLGFYIEALEQTHQEDTAERMKNLQDEDVIAARFVKILPVPPLIPESAE